MDISLPAWLGALVGMIVAAAIYAPAIRLVERQLRRTSGPKSPDQHAAFEDRLSVMRRLILAFDVTILAAAGYWIGNMFDGKLFGASGG
jgi:prolipoprotein diacylglyceryltransferase